MSDPGPHTEPPSDFNRVTLPIITHGGSLFRTHPPHRGSLLFRLHTSEGRTWKLRISWRKLLGRPCVFRGLSSLAIR